MNNKERYAKAKAIIEQLESPIKDFYLLLNEELFTALEDEQLFGGNQKDPTESATRKAAKALLLSNPEFAEDLIVGLSLECQRYSDKISLLNQDLNTIRFLAKFNGGLLDSTANDPDLEDSRDGQ